MRTHEGSGFWIFQYLFLVCEEESVFDAVSVVNVQVDIEDASERRCKGMDGKHDVVHVAKPILDFGVINLLQKKWPVVKKVRFETYLLVGMFHNKFIVFNFILKCTYQ